TATCATWSELGRAIVAGGTGSGVTTTNPCVVPTQANCNTPFTSGSTTLPNGIIRVVEVAGQAGCTLVEVRATPLSLSLIAPFATGAQANFTGSDSVSFTFVNSCGVAGPPSAANSNLTVVVGGSS